MPDRAAHARLHVRQVAQGRVLITFRALVEIHVQKPS
jgi:hypothetical protein